MPGKVWIGQPSLSRLALEGYATLLFSCNMINACDLQCYFDYVNIHWYGNSFAAFQSHVQNAHNRFPNYQVRIQIIELAS